MATGNKQLFLDLIKLLQVLFWAPSLKDLGIHSKIHLLKEYRLLSHVFALIDAFRCEKNGHLPASIVALIPAV